MRRLLFTALAMLLCGCSVVSRSPQACQPPTGAEIVRDLSSNEATRAHVLAFMAEIDDRPLYVESALVAFELPGGGWRLAHVFRHPDEELWKNWGLSCVLDAPFVASADFEHTPTKKQAEQFIRDTWWHSRPDTDFRLLRRDFFRERWQSSFGYVPHIPRSKPWG